MNFRHLLEQHQLARQLFKTINRWLAEAGVMMTQGTLVDATIIEAPSSTKNNEQQRDPEMHQTKKGNQWHFGMKAHIGVDAKSGLTHSLVTTAANEHDLNQLGNLLHGEEQFVSADAGYQGAPQREELAEVDVDWLIAERPGRVKTLKQHPRKNKTAINIEYMKASIRAVEHPFRIIKRQFGFVKARYKGLLKNDNQLAMLFTPGQPVSGGPNDTSVGEISVKTGNNARNGGKNSLNRLIRCVCGKKIGPDPRNFNQRVSLGRNDLLIRTFLNIKTQAETFLARYKNAKLKNHYDVLGIKCSLA